MWKKGRSLYVMEISMQMWQTVDGTHRHSVSFQADRSTIKHAALQAFRQAEPRAVLQGPPPPHTGVIPVIGACHSAELDMMTAGNTGKPHCLLLHFFISCRWRSCTVGKLSCFLGRDKYEDERHWRKLLLIHLKIFTHVWFTPPQSEWQLLCDYIDFKCGIWLWCNCHFVRLFQFLYFYGDLIHPFDFFLL